MNAFASGALVGPQAGVAIAHLTTAWAARMTGHALAEHRLHAGFERAPDEAAALTAATQSEDDRIEVCYSVFVSSLVTLGLAAGVAWLAFFPTFGVAWLAFIERLYFYYMASFVPSLVFLAVSHWLWVYYFGLEMMAMAAFFGYILAVNKRRMEILARERREQLAVELEVERGDHDEEDKEPASAGPTGEEGAETQSCHLEEHSPLIAGNAYCDSAK